MRLKQESQKMMTVCAKTGKRENVVFCFVFTVHRITLQLLVNQGSIFYW